MAWLYPPGSDRGPRWCLYILCVSVALRKRRGKGKAFFQKQGGSARKPLGKLRLERKLRLKCSPVETLVLGFASCDEEKTEGSCRVTGRDVFAVLALKGLLSGVRTQEVHGLERLPGRAYWLADLMLYERDVDHTKGQG